MGAGPSEVHDRLPWEGPELARLLAGETSDGPLGTALREADLVLAYTRDVFLEAVLRARTRRLLVHDPAPPVAGPHASRWLAGPLRTIGLSDWPDPPDLVFGEAERAAADALVRALPGRFLAVHPGSGSAAKNWPAERFLAFARAAELPKPWLLVLGPAEEPERWAGTPQAVIARDLPLRVLGSVLSRAALFVGNDSGVSHLAAAAGAPTLALFAATDPSLWSPVGRKVRPLDGRAPTAIAVEEALSEARALAAIR